MKQTITQKQQEILTLIYKYRFLNRIQIQKFLNHKYHKRSDKYKVGYDKNPRNRYKFELFIRFEIEKHVKTQRKFRY